MRRRWKRSVVLERLVGLTNEGQDTAERASSLSHPSGCAPSSPLAPSAAHHAAHPPLAPLSPRCRCGVPASRTDTPRSRLDRCMASHRGALRNSRWDLNTPTRTKCRTESDGQTLLPTRSVANRPRRRNGGDFCSECAICKQRQSAFRLHFFLTALMKCTRTVWRTVCNAMTGLCAFMR